MYLIILLTLTRFACVYKAKGGNNSGYYGSRFAVHYFYTNTNQMSSVSPVHMKEKQFN